MANDGKFMGEEVLEVAGKLAGHLATQQPSFTSYRSDFSLVTSDYSGDARTSVVFAHSFGCTHASAENF
jgi:hypothetical protein